MLRSSLPLWCHACLSDISPPGDFDHALARCACRLYPCVDGVLVADVEARHALAESIEAGDRNRSRRLLLGKHRAKHDLVFRSPQRATFSRFLRHGELVWLTEGLSLRKLFLRLGPRRLFRQVVESAQFNLYARHRFSSPSLLATIALAGVVKLRPGLVVDAPCGLGHLSWVLGRLASPADLLCLDLHPSFAFSARRFFVPQARACVAHDLNHPIPLADRSVSTMFSSDAIHYIDNRQGFVSEVRRVLSDTGIVVMSHMHNKLQYNPAAGSPLTPREYLALFDGFDVRLVPERTLLGAYLENRPVDLATPVPLTELERAPALVAIASKAPLPASVPSVRAELAGAAGEPVVNELYRLRSDGGTRYFERVVPEGLVEEYPEILEIFPARVDAGAFDTGSWPDRERLLAAGVLLDVPTRYY